MFNGPIKDFTSVDRGGDAVAAAWAIIKRYVNILRRVPVLLYCGRFYRIRCLNNCN
jgi:hypothetical protein